MCINIGVLSIVHSHGRAMQIYVLSLLVVNAELRVAITMLPSCTFLKKLDLNSVAPRKIGLAKIVTETNVVRTLRSTNSTCTAVLSKVVLKESNAVRSTNVL